MVELLNSRFALLNFRLDLLFLYPLGDLLFFVFDPLEFKVLVPKIKDLFPYYFLVLIY